MPEGVDRALAAGLAIAVVAVVAAEHPLGAAGIASVAMVLPVATSRRYPLSSALTAAVVGALLAVLPGGAAADDSAALEVPLAAAIFWYGYRLGAGMPWPRSLVGVVALTGGQFVAPGGVNPFVAMLTVGPWLCGLAVASNRRLTGLLEQRATELDEEREIFATRSVRYERARIARELHDIVAHSVSLMVVQASAGEHLAGRDRAGAAEALDSIGEAARQADAEIARLVELLDTSAVAEPVGLRIVTELVARAAASGLRVTGHLHGDIDDLDAPTTETAHRLVQEAITNAMKHAPGSSIRVEVRGGDRDIMVGVTNTAACAPGSGLERTGGGHGLAGMRERVTRRGGEFHAGPTTDGGWRVSARLPRRLAVRTR